MISKLCNYALRSRWNFFCAMFLSSVMVETVTLFYSAEVFLGMVIGSLATSAVLALIEKPSTFKTHKFPH